MNDISRLIKNISLTFNRQFISIFLGFSYSIFLARILGAESNGKYVLAMLFVNTFIQFTNLGIGSSNIYFIGKKGISVTSAILTSLLLWIGISLAGVLVGIICITFWGQVWFNGITKTLQYIALFSFPISLLSLYLLTILQGIQDFKNYNKVPIITLLISFTISLITVGILKLRIYGIFISYNIANIVSIGTVLYILKSYWYPQKNEKSHEIYKKEYIGYGSKAHLSNILAFLNYKADIFLIAYYMDPTSVGVYAIAVSIVQKLWIVSQSTSTVVFPYLSQFYGSNKDNTKNITSAIARYVLLITLILSILLALSSKFIINFFFGIQYLSAINCISILLPGIVAIGVARVFANDLAARGKPELNLYTSILVILINILLNIILIPKMGIQGAALATTIAYLFNAITKLVTYWYISNESLISILSFKKNDIDYLSNISVSFLNKLKNMKK